MSFLFKTGNAPSDAQQRYKSGFFTVQRTPRAAIKACVSTGELSANESAKDKQRRTWENRWTGAFSDTSAPDLIIAPGHI